MTVLLDSASKNSRITLSGGSLTATAGGGSVNQAVRGDTSVSSGKVYCEFRLNTNGSVNNNYFGIVASGVTISADGFVVGQNGTDSRSYYSNNGFKYTTGAGSGAYGASWTAGDVIGLAFDATSHTLEFYKNGVSQGTAFTSIAAGSWYPAYTLWDSASNNAITANFGATTFAYTLPAGYSSWDGSQSSGSTIGTGSGSLAAMTASGAGPAGGAGSVLAATATGCAVCGIASEVAATSTGTTPPAGAGSFVAMTAAGLTPAAGEGSLGEMTAAGVGTSAAFGANSLEEMTATGIASSGAVAVGAMSLEVLTATGTNISSAYATGSPSFEALTADGRVPTRGAASFQAQSATGIALPSTIARGAATMVAQRAVGAGTGNGLSNGAASFQVLSASGSGTTIGVATATVSLRTAQASGVGISGTVGTAAVLEKVMTATGAAAPADVATGAAQMVAMSADAFGVAALAEVYAAYVMNSSNHAVTSYDPYAFNSMAEIGGRYYAAGTGGIYELVGSDDNGSDIAAVLRTGKMDHKSVMLKRLPEVLVAARSSGDMRITVYPEDGDSFDYDIPFNGDTDLRQSRVKPGKGMRSRYFQVELTNQANSTFEVDSLQVNMTKTANRLG